MVGRIRDPKTGNIRSAESSKGSRRNEDRDANPMNDSIGSEVVRRSDRAKFVKQGPSTKALAETDLQAVLSKGSGTREKWLKKALQQVQDGELPAVEVYNILKVPDFSADLKDKTGRSIYRLLMSKLSLFSKGQQRFLAKECPLAQMFGGEGGGQAASSETTPKAGEEAAEAMMARVREFVRQQQGLELDEAAAQPVAEPEPAPAAESAFPMPGMPCSAPVAAQSVDVKPPPRQDMSAVANIIARASSAAVQSDAVAPSAKPVPAAPAEALQAEAAPPSKKPEDKREEKNTVKQRASSSSSSRPRGKKAKRRKSPSSSRSRSRSSRSLSRDRRRR